MSVFKDWSEKLVESRDNLIQYIPIEWRTHLRVTLGQVSKGLFPEFPQAEHQIMAHFCVGDFNELSAAAQMASVAHLIGTADDSRHFTGRNGERVTVMLETHLTVLGATEADDEDNERITFDEALENMIEIAKQHQEWKGECH